MTEIANNKYSLQAVKEWGKQEKLSKKSGNEKESY